jgi:predicted ATPase
MLTQISLRNFKSWRELPDLRLARLTGFFGTNSSGKSSLLQLLLMLKQTADSADRQQVLFLGDEQSDKSLVVLGGFEDVVYKGVDKKTLELSIAWDSVDEVTVAASDRDAEVQATARSLTFNTTIQRDRSGSLRVERFVYGFNGHTFGMRRQTSSDDVGYEAFVEGGSFKLERARGRPRERFSAPIKCYGFPDDVRAAYQNAGVLSDLQLAFERQLQRTYYLGPLREYPFRDYRWSGSEPVDMGRRGEKFVPALLAAAQRNVRVGRGRARKSIEQCVAGWLKRLGLIHDFSVQEVSKANSLYEVRVQRGPDSAPVLLPDVGFGVSQVLPVIVLCFYVPEGSTILLEQPEIHLHPSVQGELADLFLEVVKSRNVQIIVESHSEHLLRRLQRRVAEDSSDNDSTLDRTLLYFCRSSNGASEITKLELDLYGAIRNWPEGFFGDEMADIAATAAAARARREKERDS